MKRYKMRDQRRMIVYRFNQFTVWSHGRLVNMPRWRRR